MRIRNAELWIAVLAIAAITVIYLGLVSLSGVPEAGDFWGHSLGIIGFILMLMTEVLYSLRKRSRIARWGRLSHWLSFHIFTGLVGPYMVLLHTSWKFNGLAGILMLFTILIVISGIIGRYIYTSIPRTADGVIMGIEQIQEEIRRLQTELMVFDDTHPSLSKLLTNEQSNIERQKTNLARQIFGRFFTDSITWWKWQVAQRGLGRNQRAYTKVIWENRRKLRDYNRHVVSLSLARRMLGIWHTIHIPIGVALFSLAIVHIFATLYFATFLH